ncbi:MAG: TerC family protein [Anaerolineae bacterium]|nr:TerC family protein [Anaerolineae bacterium]
MDWITDPQVWIALVTLTVLEIVLGIDNIIFISILAGKLPHHQQERGRVMGLGLAMLTRIVLLLSLSVILRLTAPLFTVLGNEISGRDLILVAGGLFLLVKSTREIHDKLEGAAEHHTARAAASFTGVIVQIALFDIVFSLDSVITAIGMANKVGIMVAAIMIAVGVMMLSARSISAFIEEHPTVKILALSFLLLIGVALIAEGFDVHIPKGYIYFAMAFSVLVELLNMRLRAPQASAPVKLRGPYGKAARPDGSA